MMDDLKMLGFVLIEAALGLAAIAMVAAIVLSVSGGMR